jgi:hypothetical protein
MAPLTISASDSAMRKGRSIRAAVGTIDTSAPMGLVASCPAGLGSGSNRRPSDFQKALNPPLVTTSPTPPHQNPT